MTSDGLQARAGSQPFWAWGLAMGFLPVLSALLFRTYSYHVTPFWYEQFRQFDAIFVLFELAVITIARVRGLDYGKLAYRLSTGEKLAVAAFLSTFWLSSVFVSQVPALSSLRIVIWCIHLAFGCAVFHLAGSLTPKGIESFAKGCFLGLCAYVPILAAHFAFAPDPGSLPRQEIIWTSALPGYLSVRLFGFTTASLALLAIGLLWHRTRFVLADWWLHAGLVLSLTLTFWSGTRGGVYAVLFATLAAPFLMRAKPRLVWVGVIAGATLIAALASELLVQPSSAFGIFHDRNGGMSGNFTSGRTEIWLQSIALIADRPMLGWGESAMWWLLKDNQGHQQPHNALLQLMLSWGAIATSAALFVLVRIALCLLTKLPHAPTALTPVIVLVGLTVMSSVDGILYNPRTTLLCIVAAASAIAIIARKSAPSREANFATPEGSLMA